MGMGLYRCFSLGLGLWGSLGGGVGLGLSGGCFLRGGSFLHFGCGSLGFCGLGFGGLWFGFFGFLGCLLLLYRRLVYDDSRGRSETNLDNLLLGRLSLLLHQLDGTRRT